MVLTTLTRMDVENDVDSGCLRLRVSLGVFILQLSEIGV